MPEAEVQPVATQGAQAGAEPVDLEIPLQGLLAQARGSPARGVEAFGQFGDRLLEALRDGREVPFVVGDERRVRLEGETVG